MGTGAIAKPCWLKPMTDRQLVYFCYDLDEFSQRRRCHQFLRYGARLETVSMRRANGDQRPIYWPNIHLFTTPYRALALRLIFTALAIIKLVPQAPRLARAERFICRNADMLIIAVTMRALGQWINGWRQHPRMSRPILVYECLDIHPIFTRDDLIGRMTRALERWLIAQCDAIIVSSTDFAGKYFRDRQQVDRPIYLVENKFDPAGYEIHIPVRALNGPKTRIGLVGTIRCAPSLHLLAKLAHDYANQFEIHIFGQRHDHAIGTIWAHEIADNPAITYHGPYHYPEDLAAIYGALDYVWAQDMWQQDHNSRWLLPNRLYEAGFFECPMIAVAGTKTAERLAKMGIGLVIARADVTLLASALGAIDNRQYLRFVNQLRANRDGLFAMRRPDLEPFFIGDAAPRPKEQNVAHDGTNWHWSWPWRRQPSNGQ